MPRLPAAPIAPTVLIIDDDADIRALMSTIFDRAGVAYDTVDAGEPALQSAAERRPSVYVLDALMPGMHGHEVCRRLKADPRTHAPVLIVSAEASEADVAAGFAAGCDDFLAKPFRPRELLARVNKLLADRGDDTAAR